MKYVAVTKVDNDIIIHGDSCCTTLQELYTALVDKNTTEIEIRKDFATENFTYSGLCDFVEYSAAIVPHVRILVDETVYDTVAEAVRDLKGYTRPDEFIYALEHNPTRVLSTIQTLCNYYLQVHDESAIANNKIATQLIQIEELNKELGYIKTDYNKLLETKNDVDAKLHALVSRVNFRYEKTVNADSMFIASSNNYNHILYVKEITRVHYTDTLLYYLQEILKTLYGAPVRTVVIEPYYSYGRAALYPTMKPHWNLSYKDVYAGDIFMAGYQPKLMSDILQDPNHVNYLIVLDRGGYSYPHIDCGNVTVIYTASDIEDVDKTIVRDRVISYSEKTLYIPYIDDFDQLSPEEKIQKYSSMKVTKALIKYLEEVN
jgi:hypothetical protein